MNSALAGVVIVHFGAVEQTRSCCESVLGDESEIERRIVVVDNTGTLHASGLPAEVALVSRPDNPGFGAAINTGVAHVDRDERCTLYVVLNNDAALISGYLRGAADALEVGVGAAGGPICDSTDAGVFWYAGGRIDFLTGTVGQGSSRIVARRRRDVGYIPGTALALSTIAWREVGGFDERFFLYNEDLDLCLRLRRAGWRLRFEPEMTCVHSLGGSTGSSEHSPLYLENLTSTRFLPFRSRAYRLYLGVVHTLYNSARVLVLVLRHKGRSGPYVGAVVRGHVRALGTILT